MFGSDALWKTFCWCVGVGTVGALVVVIFGFGFLPSPRGRFPKGFDEAR